MWKTEPFYTQWSWEKCSLSQSGILQARILEWVAVSPSRGLSGPGIEPTSLMSPALASGWCTSTCWKARDIQ